MRVAVCISGQTRTWKTCLPEIVKFFKAQPVQVDFFYHTWEDCPAFQNHPSKPVADNVALTEEDITTINSMLNPVSHSITPTLKTLFPERDLRQWASLFYSMCTANQLKKDYELANGFTYDVVFKMRFDILFRPETVIDRQAWKIAGLDLYTSFCRPLVSEFDMYNFSDVTFLGTSLAVDIVCNCLHKVLFYNERIGSNEIFNMYNVGPGVMLYKYLSNYGCNMVKMDELDYVIVRENMNIDCVSEAGYNYYRKKHFQWYTQ